MVIFRISGKYVISTFIPMEMLNESKMDPTGATLANTELENAKEILLKPAPSSFTIFIPKLSPSLSVLKPIQLTGLDLDKSVHPNSALTGTRLTLALQELKEINGKLKWQLQLKN